MQVLGLAQVTSTWRKVAPKFEGEEAFEDLEKIDRLEVFQQYIRCAPRCLSHALCPCPDCLTVVCAAPAGHVKGSTLPQFWWHVWGACAACLVKVLLFALHARGAVSGAVDAVRRWITAHAEAIQGAPARRELEKREREEKEREKEERKRRERQNRDAFKALMARHREEGLITAKMRWKVPSLLIFRHAHYRTLGCVCQVPLLPLALLAATSPPFSEVLVLLIHSLFGMKVVAMQLKVCERAIDICETVEPRLFNDATGVPAAGEEGGSICGGGQEHVRLAPARAVRGCGGGG